MGVRIVTLPSGLLPPDMSQKSAMCHLIEGMEFCVSHAKECGVELAMEPMAGHLVDHYPAYLELWRPFEHLPFGLCYDLAHAHSAYEDIPGVIADTPELVHVHVPGGASRTHRYGVEYGGDAGLNKAISALRAADYQGHIAIAPSGMGQMVEAARRAFARLQAELARPVLSEQIYKR
jgi:sugar phosphate isomerase/epimerase